jgi:hypothetical protein
MHARPPVSSCLKRFLSLKTIVVISGNGLEFSGFIGELSSVLVQYAVNYAMQYPQCMASMKFEIRQSFKILEQIIFSVASGF